MDGVKYSKDKLPIFTLVCRQFPKAISEVARSSRGGHLKYEEFDKNWDNWKNVPNGKQEYKEACQRHLMESEQHTFNEDMAEYDPKIRHLAQVVWNGLAALELELMEEESKQKVKSSKTSVNWVVMDITKPEDLKKVGINIENQSKVRMEEFKGSLTGFPDANSTITTWYHYGQNPYHNKKEWEEKETYQQKYYTEPQPSERLSVNQLLDNK